MSSVAIPDLSEKNRENAVDLPVYMKTLPAFMWHCLRPYRFFVVAFFTVMVCAGLWTPIHAWLLKSIFNGLEGAKASHDFSSVIWLSGALILNHACHSVSWQLARYLTFLYQPRIKNHVMGQAFEYVHGHSYRFFQDAFAGRVASQISKLADSVERMVCEVSRLMIWGATTAIVSIVSLWYVDVRFFICIFIWMIIFVVISLLASSRLVILCDRLSDEESTVSGHIVDSITNAQTVRSFVGRTFEMTLLHRLMARTKAAFRAKEKFLAFLHLAQGLSITGLLMAMLAVLLYLYQKDAVTVGDFALIITVTLEVGFAVWWGMEQVDEFNKAFGVGKQCLESLFVPHAIQDVVEAKPLVVTKGTIEFCDVQFRYHDEHALFSGKSVVIEGGQKVGLVGYSGGGKTTFVNLIQRLFDIESGVITIDGQDISRVTQESLHQNIALIPQDPSLFHRSLMDNICYGTIGATHDDGMKAAINAHAHDFIKALPAMYDTAVGERGIKLSGGQRQRIAIARAMVKNAPILILDEATSQLDSITENYIQESLWTLMEKKTTLVIAHRLSTLLRMDRLLVFDQGVIVQDGCHSDLIAVDGLYKTLWETQVGNYIGDHENEQC